MSDVKCRFQSDVKCDFNPDELDYNDSLRVVDPERVCELSSIYGNRYFEITEKEIKELRPEKSSVMWTSMGCSSSLKRRLLMKRRDYIEVDGIVNDTPYNLPFTILLETGQTIKAQPSGDLRRKFIRCRIGDKVTVRIISDLSESGRIIRRLTT